MIYHRRRARGEIERIVILLNFLQNGEYVKLVPLHKPPPLPKTQCTELVYEIAATQKVNLLVDMNICIFNNTRAQT
jgi:hypothetical protein